MLCVNTVEDTVKWFDSAKPNPSDKDRSTQIGVHIEETAEFLQELKTDDKDINSLIYDTIDQLELLATALKNSDITINFKSRTNVLDALCDQIITAVGVAQSNSMNIIAGLNEVNRSNFSKFDDDGRPVLDINRKIIKSSNYTKPELSLMV